MSLKNGDFLGKFKTNAAYMNDLCEKHFGEDNE